MMRFWCNGVARWCYFRGLLIELCCYCVGIIVIVLFFSFDLARHATHVVFSTTSIVIDLQSEKRGGMSVFSRQTTLGGKDTNERSRASHLRVYVGRSQKGFVYIFYANNLIIAKLQILYKVK